MAEVGDGEDRRTLKRREDDRWIREMVQGIVDTNHAALEEERTRSRKIAHSAGIGYLILMLGLAFGLWSIERRDAHRFDKAIAASVAAQRDSSVAAFKECQRVNRLRKQANGGNEVIFATLWVSAQREQSLSKAPGPQQTTHVRSSKALRFLARKAKHTHLTNCQLATFHAATYTPPHPIPFNPRTDPLLMLLRSIE